MGYKEDQEQHQISLIENLDPCFYGAHNQGTISWRQNRDIIKRRSKKVLMPEDTTKNLYESIRDNAIAYMANNNIKWWHLAADSDDRITGHIGSSQVACLNHLFPLRDDPDILLKIMQNIDPEFEEMLPVPHDKTSDGKEDTGHYIAFEAISCNNLLNEQDHIRGSLCTSIDALMLAKKQGHVWLIPIEWKYTENYPNTPNNDKSCEDRDKEPRGSNGKGMSRLNSYTELINKSQYLKPSLNGVYLHHIYFREPFYQMMRQTLWSEQVIKYESDQWADASRFLHLHIVPKGNHSLLDQVYGTVTPYKGLVDTWRQQLKHPEYYKMLDPSDFLSPILISEKYNTLAHYLQTRYWS